MKRFILFLVILSPLAAVRAQQAWPKKIATADGTIITIYQLQPESLKGNVFTARSAVSVQHNPNPVFGAFWWTAKVATDRDERQLILNSVQITDIRIPADSDKNQLRTVKAAIEAQLPGAAGALSLDDILSSLEQQQDENRVSAGISTQPPVILYVQHPAVLVTIDGTPQIKAHSKYDLPAVVNTPFTIVRNEDAHFYLWGAGRWYVGDSVTGPYAVYTGHPDHRLRKIERTFEKTTPSDTVPAIIVTTAPAELLQTDSTPTLVPIEGSSLLYVSNSPDNIFMDTRTQSYYILLAGRWYTSTALQGGTGWTYVASDKLPADFAKIPEGSPKDNVLASVAGTDAAREAVMDAQIPQTAKVDRKTASADVVYDGEPRFEQVPGTMLQYAVNTSVTVLLYNGAYYALDNGVWFYSPQPTGPWAVSTERPAGLDAIPPTCPVYNCKYVDIYDVTPDYIYMGYTPGYLNSFIYGPTVVYGTGFYYTPWIGRFYYPRPWSWGFGMVYNPWYGWGFGPDFGFDWFNFDLGLGWWGPAFYYPCFWGLGWGYGPHGFYGRDPRFESHTHIYAHNNLYRGRRGIAEHPVRPMGESRSSGVLADRRGNVFERESRGTWMSHAQAVKPEISELNHMHAMQDRGVFRSANFQRMQHFSAPHFGGFRGGGRR